MNLNLYDLMILQSEGEEIKNQEPEDIVAVNQNAPNNEQADGDNMLLVALEELEIQDHSFIGE